MMALLREAVVRIIIVCFLSKLAVYGTMTASTDPTTASISVWESSSTLLMAVDCEDADTATAVTCKCQLSATSPTDGPFTLLDNYVPQVYYSGAGLTTTTATTYTLSLACYNYSDTSIPDLVGVTATATVTLIANSAPYFTSPGATADTVNAQSSSVGDLVYTASATDSDGNAITYTMTQDPDDGFFDINEGTGEIRIASSLLSSTESSYRLTLEACDTEDCSATSQSVTVPIEDSNTAPEFSTLPASVDVSESATGGTLLTTLTVSDAEGHDVTTTCSVSPSNEAYKFTYSTDLQTISLSRLTDESDLLNYESGVTTYTITCVASDGYVSTEGVLTVNVVNVNEAPVFAQTMYYCTLDESDAGVSQCSMELSATDPDTYSYSSINTVNTGSVINDNSYNSDSDAYDLTYALVTGNNSERFALVGTDSLSLTFAVDYDVDKSVMPQSVIITVQATDYQGLTGSTQISITVNDVNDNTCYFTDTVLSSTVNQGTEPGTLGSFYAEDDDLTSPNNDVTIVSLGSSSEYMYVFSDGQVQYKKQIPESEDGSTFYQSVSCQDGGSPVLSATATYALYYTTTTTTSTTTAATTTSAATTTAATTTAASDGSTSVWDDDAFVAVFATLMVLLALALLALLAWKCGWCGGNTPTGKRPLTHVKPYEDEYGPPSRGSRRELQWDRGDAHDDYRGRSAGVVSPSGIRALPAPRY